MKIMILGIDGYIGWPLALHLRERGHEVTGLDNLIRRFRVEHEGSSSLFPIDGIHKKQQQFPIDTTALRMLSRLDSDLDAIVHLAEQPSAAWSMKNADTSFKTQRDNVLGTLNLLWLMREFCPNAHLVKIGTMGEYGTPDCVIPEGAIPNLCLDRTFEGDPFYNRDLCPMSGLPFPRSAGSFYHLSKVHDTHNIIFACKTWGLCSTDIMQGVVFGHLPGTRFDYDECFIPGTQIVCNPETKSIEDVKVGDRVLTHNGRFKKVEKIFSRAFCGNMLNIKTANRYAELTCTPGHHLLIVKRSGGNGYPVKFSEPTWTEAINLHKVMTKNEEYNAALAGMYEKAKSLREQGGYGAHRIAKIIGIKPTTVESWVNHNHKPREKTDQREKMYFVYGVLSETIDTEFLDCKKYNIWKENKYNKNRKPKNPIPERINVDYDFMRFCGLYLAEGNISSGYQITFSFNHEKDADLISFIKHFSITKLGINPDNNKNNNVVGISSKALAKWMLDLFKTGARRKRIPLWMLLLPKEKQKGLLDGIYEGDGTQGNSLEIVNPHICEAIRLMWGRQGEYSNVYTRTRNNNLLPEGRVMNGESQTFNCYHMKLSSKSSKGYVIHEGKILIPIRAVKMVEYDGFVHNLHVADDNSYIANTFAVHNCFGTVINRFCVQAVIGMPLTVYGRGGQTRGYLPLKDSIECLTLSLENPPKKGEYRVFNQFAETYSVNELAYVVTGAGIVEGLHTKISHIDNPRKESEHHFYQPIHEGLAKLGYHPSWHLEEEIQMLIQTIKPYKDDVRQEVIMPKIQWTKEGHHDFCI